MVFKTVLGDNSDADIELGYGEKFYNELSSCDNESLYIIRTLLSEESAIPMIIDDDTVDHIPKNPPPCGRSYVCAHGAAARTYNCTKWCSSCFWWR